MSKTYGRQIVILMLYCNLQEMRISRCGCLQFMNTHQIGGDGYGNRRNTNRNNIYVSIHNNCTSYNYCDTLHNNNYSNKPKTR